MAAAEKRHRCTAAGALRRHRASGLGERNKRIVLLTSDGGTTWQAGKVPGPWTSTFATFTRSMKRGLISSRSAMATKGAFAASGTCLVVHGDRNVWFGTGGAKVPRVFRSVDRGRSWTVHETPIRAGNAASGIFSLAFSLERRHRGGRRLQTTGAVRSHRLPNE